MESNTGDFLILKKPRFSEGKIPEKRKRWSIFFTNIERKEKFEFCQINPSFFKKESSIVRYSFFNGSVKHKILKKILSRTGLKETKYKGKSLKKRINCLQKCTLVWGRFPLFQRKESEEFIQNYINDNTKGTKRPFKEGGRKRISRNLNILLRNVKLNHFPNSIIISTKSLLYKRLMKMKNKFGKEAFNFVPHSFSIPEEISSFLKYHNNRVLDLKHSKASKKSSKKKRTIDTTKKPGKSTKKKSKKKKKGKFYYITKPKSSSRGRGIKLVAFPNDLLFETEKKLKKKLSKEGKLESFVVSEYIKKPLLLHKKKFDLRLYVLCTSLNPLSLFLHKDGIVRRSSKQYSLKNLKSKYTHLTNFSINKKRKTKKNEEVDKKSEENELKSEIKWSLNDLKHYFTQNNIKGYKKLFSKIRDVIIKTILSCETEFIDPFQLNVLKDKNPFFELFGFDILVDETMQPHLLEVNGAPSFSYSSEKDRKIKERVLIDTLNLVGVFPKEKKSLTNILGAPQELKRSRSLSSNELLMIGGKRRSVEAILKDKKLFFLSKEELNMIQNYQEENFHRGNFKRIFPTSKSEEKYSKFFQNIKKSNLLMFKYFKKRKEKNINVACY